ncbi:MAG: hypothetical protein WCR20_05100 [Verrucomicrobiota bacterium]
MKRATPAAANPASQGGCDQRRVRWITGFCVVVGARGSSDDDHEGRSFRPAGKGISERGGG